MKIIIAGGRDVSLSTIQFAQINWVNSLLKSQDPYEGITEVVSGGARGVDSDGEKWARHHNIPVKVFKANWSRYGAAAGPIRNAQMAEYADAVILFPGGNGTQSMYRIACRHDLAVFDFRVPPSRSIDISKKKVITEDEMKKMDSPFPNEPSWE